MAFLASSIRKRNRLGAPVQDELHVLLQTVITWLMKMLTRHVVLIEEVGPLTPCDPWS